MKKVSAIIPTYNRIRDLERLLESLTQVPLHQVIVCDDGCDDETPLRVPNWASRLPLVYLRQERKGERAAAARNMGLGAANGDIALFLDDDVVVPPNLLDLYSTHWEQESPGLWLGLRQRCAEWPPDQDQAQDDRLHKPLRPNHPGWLLCYTCNCAINLPCPDFDEDFVGWGCEDAEWAFRAEQAGFRIKLCPEITVWHIDAESPRGPGLFAKKPRAAIDETPFVLNCLRMLDKHAHSPVMKREVWLRFSGYELVDDRPVPTRVAQNPQKLFQWARQRLDQL